MNGNRMRRVKSGDRLVIPADTYNRTLDAVETVEAFGTRNGTLRAPSHLGLTEAVVHNASGVTLPRYSVVGISGSGSLADGAINGADAGRMMSQPWYLDGVLPTLRHYGKDWAVLKDAAADGRTVRAFWKGLCTVPVWFKPNAGDARYADLPWDGGWEGLAAQFSGRARIVAKDTSAIDTADLTKLGLSTPSTGSVYFCVIDIGDPVGIEIQATPTSASLISGATDRWEYEWSEVVVGADRLYTKPSGLRSHADLGLMISAAEFGNATAGPQPDGVDTSALLGTFEKKPIGDGIVVRIRGPFFTGEQSSSGDADAFWIGEPVANQYWGECPSGSSSSSGA